MSGEYHPDWVRIITDIGANAKRFVPWLAATFGVPPQTAMSAGWKVLRRISRRPVPAQHLRLFEHEFGRPRLLVRRIGDEPCSVSIRER